MGALKIVMDNNQLKEPKFNYKSELLKLVPDEDIVNDYIAVGKTMKRTPTKTGLTLFVNECDKHGLSYELAMIIVIDKGWRGFNYLWLKEEDLTKYNIKKQTHVKPKEIPVTMEQIKNQASREEIIYNDKVRINEAYIEYMDNLNVPDLPSIRFDSLVEYGCIKLATDETPKLKNYYDSKKAKAVDLLRKKYNIDNAVSRPERQLWTNINLMIDSGKYPEIITKMKELVLIDYFDKQIKDSKNKIFEL